LRASGKSPEAWQSPVPGELQSLVRRVTKCFAVCSFRKYRPNPPQNLNECRNFIYSDFKNISGIRINQDKKSKTIETTKKEKK
jgi:hypothetical protein